MADLKDTIVLEEKKKRRKSRSKKPYSSKSLTTGDIKLNIDRFNKAMGTYTPGFGDVYAPIGDGEVQGGCGECCGDAGGDGGCCESLTEAKRYVRRYYIRPQNIFCSNKAEIIKTLIDLDDTNCSVYTLNNLGDEKDVSKLMNSDIIYYYDNGILYDKNKVKVMDYDLSIKKEEERKHFANVDKTPDKEFKAEYEDRMTDVTELEEAMSTNAQFSIEDLATALEQYEEVFVGGHIDNEGIIVDDGFSSSPYSATLTYVEEDKLRSGTYTIYEWFEGADGELMEGKVLDGYTSIEALYADLCATTYEAYITGTSGEEPFWKSLAPQTESFSADEEVTADEAFELTYEDYDAVGNRLNEAMDTTCCICGEPLDGYGNNPQPYADDGRCCDGCNIKFVIPARLQYER